MKTLNIKSLKYFGKCKYEVLDSIYGFTSKENLMAFTENFAFGKVYLIKGELFHGAFALSYLIAGRVKENYGSIKIDGNITTIEKRKDISCIAGECPKKYRKWTINKIIKTGLKLYNREDEYQSIIEKYDLIDREDRKFNQLSFHKWLASLAIADSFEKTIICFPYVTGEYFINTSFVNGEFISVFNDLKRKGKLIIIPSDADHIFKNVVDDIIVLREYNNSEGRPTTAST